MDSQNGRWFKPALAGRLVVRAYGPDMAASQPLHEQLLACERWCAERSEKEFGAVAAKGLRVLAEHHAETASPMEGFTPRPDGWFIRSIVLGFWGWFAVVIVVLGCWLALTDSVWGIFVNSRHRLLFVSLASLFNLLLLSLAALGIFCRRHEVSLANGRLVVRRRLLHYFVRTWELAIHDEVRVGLAYRGEWVPRRSEEGGGSFAVLSLVVASGESEVAFGTDLDRPERARLAILIDEFYNRDG
jgi:hypothetical protein